MDEKAYQLEKWSWNQKECSLEEHGKDIQIYQLEFSLYLKNT